jgi:hypothetical protein
MFASQLKNEADAVAWVHVARALLTLTVKLLRFFWGPFLGEIISSGCWGSTLVYTVTVELHWRCSPSDTRWRADDICSNYSWSFVIGYTKYIKLFHNWIDWGPVGALLFFLHFWWKGTVKFQRFKIANGHQLIVHLIMFFSACYNSTQLRFTDKH